MVWIISKSSSSFSPSQTKVLLINEITNDQLEGNCLELLTSGKGEPGLDLDEMKMMSDGKISIQDYRVNIGLIFYKVGLIGIKADPYSKFSWNDAGTISVSSAEINDKSKIAIHQTFWRCLGIDYKDDDYFD
jgi:hypothetical protein